jgi:EmrB/QacA subfamily drug resistance transporter
VNAPHPHRWQALALLSVGVSLIIIDATIVNVALPAIIADLHLSLSTAEWTNTSYSLVFAALLIVVGKAGDLKGRKRVFLLGVGVFLVASVLAGLAPNGATLIAARLLQGVGGAMILPTSLSIVNATFTGRERATAFGIWGATIGGMAALGPLAGGFLTTYANWRWVFGVNVPIGLALLVAGARIIPESSDPDATLMRDWLGAITNVAGFGLLVFALVEGQTYGWLHDPDTGSLSPIPFAFAGAAILLAAFATIERRRAAGGEDVLVDLDLFRLPSFGWGSLAALIVSLGEFGLLFVIPLFLQNIRGKTAFETGAMLVAMAAGAFIAAGAAAGLARRLAGRTIVAIGMGLEAIGLLAFSTLITPDVSDWEVMGPLFIYGLGVGLATAQLTNLILQDVPPARSGEASGVQSTARQIGSALGIALLGAALGTLTYTNTRDALVAGGSPPEAASAVARTVQRSAGTAIPALTAAADSPTLGDTLATAYTDAVRRTGDIAGAFILLGLVATLRIPRRAPASDAAPTPA